MLPPTPPPVMCLQAIGHFKKKKERKNKKEEIKKAPFDMPWPIFLFLKERTENGKTCKTTFLCSICTEVF